MSYLVLARKYRPQSFDKVIGQSHVTQTLKNAIRAGRVAHAILFAGPRGVGKTSVARILAKAMNCKKGPTPTPCGVCTSCREITDGIAVDVLEIDGASNRGINEIRELRENIKYMPNHSRFKIYIIDEVHMLTTEAFNALLKTLEEPPSHVLFIFATTEPNKIPVTILSRCQRYDFRRIDNEDIVRHLQEVCKEASFDISEQSLRLLARQASGSMRDALSLLDQVMVYSEGKVTDEEVVNSLGAIDPQAIFDLSSALFSHNTVGAINSLDDLYNRGYDLKQLYRQLLEHFRHLLIVKMGDGNGYDLIDLSPHEIALMQEQVRDISMETINQIFSTFFEAEPIIRLSDDPKLALEALFIKIAQFKPVVSFDEIVNKLNSLASRLQVGDVSYRQTGVRETPEPRRLFPPKNHEDFPRQNRASAKDLTETWQQLVSILSDRCPSLLPSLENAVLTKVDDGSLEITVKGNSFYAARLRDKTSVAEIEKACAEFFNRRMKIKVVEESSGPVRNRSQAETDRAKRLKREALSHPVVTDALEIFQGKVIDVKIL